MTAIEIITDDNIVNLGAPSAPFKREIEVVLAASERASYGESLARKKIERDHLVEAAKEESRRRKNAIADVGSEVNRLAAAVDTGKEFREVMVYRRLEGAHVVIRAVAGDVEVDRRAATVADQQIEIPGLDDADDFASRNYQTDGEMVASSSGAEVYVSSDDDDGEVPSEEPVLPKAKKGRGKKAAK